MNGTWISLKSNQVQTTAMGFGWKSRPQLTYEQRQAGCKRHSEYIETQKKLAKDEVRSSKIFKIFEDEAREKSKNGAGIGMDRMKDCREKLLEEAISALKGLIEKTQPKRRFRTGFRIEMEHTDRDKVSIEGAAGSISSKLTQELYEIRFPTSYLNFSYHGSVGLARY
jgi:hypothetical protein